MRHLWFSHIYPPYSSLHESNEIRKKRQSPACVGITTTFVSTSWKINMYFDANNGNGRSYWNHFETGAKAAFCMLPEINGIEWMKPLQLMITILM
jgi:hypothetical protein